MTTPTLDLEAMAEKISSNVICSAYYLSGYSNRTLKEAILSALREVAEMKDKEIRLHKKDSEDNASELCAIESALGFKDFLDEKGIFQNCHTKAIERIRDLIAKEGELGDLKEEFTRLTELVELAWGVIANAGGGNWDIESTEWKKAAERWRDDYHQLLNESTKKEV